MEDEYTEISNGPAKARIRKVRTGNGSRLEVYSPGSQSRVRLDALLLESLSWQSPQEISDWLDAPHVQAGDQREGEEPETGAPDYSKISNEFATVLVRLVGAGEGRRLEIFSPKLDHRTYLDAPLLQSLSHQSPEKLSEALEEPYGPTGAAH